MNKSWKENIFIGALIGTKGDSYDANEDLQEDVHMNFININVKYLKSPFFTRLFTI